MASCEVKSTRLTITRGDTARLKFTVTESDCTTVVDLTGFDQMFFTIKRSNYDSDAAAVWQGVLPNDIEVTEPTDGELEVTIPPSASKLLRGGRLYFWDLSLSGGAYDKFSPLWGTLLVSAETTQG